MMHSFTINVNIFQATLSIYVKVMHTVKTDLSRPSCPCPKEMLNAQSCKTLRSLAFQWAKILVS